MLHQINKENYKDNYLNNLRDLMNPISERSGMIINTPYNHLAETKKLLMVGFNPGGVPSDLMTSIKEDFTRHSENPSFNALDERWGNHASGNHPIQLLYQALIKYTELMSSDILQTNIYWQRSSDINKLKIDSMLENNCREGLILNIKTHKPKSIIFLGHKAAETAQKWADNSFSNDDIKYPWGNNHKIKFYSMKFNNHRIKAFSIPHPSRFGFGSDMYRLAAILKAANNCDIELKVNIHE